VSLFVLRRLYFPKFSITRWTSTGRRWTYYFHPNAL